MFASLTYRSNEVFKDIISFLNDPEVDLNAPVEEPDPESEEPVDPIAPPEDIESTDSTASNTGG